MPLRSQITGIAILAALAGCGGDEPAAPAERPAALEVAALGDSITAGSPLWDPDPAIRAQLPGATPRSQYEFWAQRALGGARRARIRNCGVFGERTDQIGPRLEDCARGAQVVVLQGGINDLAQGGTPERAAQNLGSMVRAAKRLKLRALLVEVLPWNNGYPGAVPRIKRLNSLIRRLGADEGVAVVGFYAALDDPGKPGRMPARLTSDGNHPNVEGYRLLGRLVAKALSALQDPES